MVSTVRKEYANYEGVVSGNHYFERLFYQTDLGGKVNAFISLIFYTTEQPLQYSPIGLVHRFLVAVIPRLLMRHVIDGTRRKPTHRVYFF